MSATNDHLPAHRFPALPEDYIPTCRETLQNLHGDLGHTHRRSSAKAGAANKKIFNNEQISDHFAIIPTAHERRASMTWKGKFTDMIARRFARGVLSGGGVRRDDPHLEGGGAESKPRGKCSLPGWLGVYGKTTVEDEAADSRRCRADARGQSPREDQRSEVHAEATKPPPRYTEATLLSAMEGAGKLVDDDDHADAMKERGLGTRRRARTRSTDSSIRNTSIVRCANSFIRREGRAGDQFLSGVKAEGSSRVPR